MHSDASKTAFDAAMLDKAQRKVTQWIVGEAEPPPPDAVPPDVAPADPIPSPAEVPRATE